MTESGRHIIDLDGAIAGETRALKELIGLLISVDQETQTAALATVQGIEDPGLWRGLLALLAMGGWPGESTQLIHPGSRDHQRLGLKLRYLFLYDLMTAVSRVKEDVLLAGLKSETPATRAASAELLGDRHTGRASTSLAAALRDPDDSVRWHAVQALGQIGDPASIQPLVDCFYEPDPVLIRQARLALVTIGQQAVPFLIKALSDSRDQVRWEAAKALVQINDSAAAPALVSALEDNNAGVRWLAAEGLINLKREGLEPLLHTLVGHRYSTWLGHSAHHVLHELGKRREFEPIASTVIEALESHEPAVAVPVAALAALEALRGSGNG